MYHEDQLDVDVELLAECGQIAHRLRCLEKTWFCELKELQRKSVCAYTAKPKLIASITISQKLNDLLRDNYNSTNVNDDRNNQELVNRLIHLEDTVIKIHFQHELLKQQKRIVAAKRVHIKENMNYSALSGSSGSNNNNNNNNDLSTSPTAAAASAAIHEQLISSNNGEHATGSGDNNNKKSILNNDDDDDKDQSSTMTATNNKQQTQNIYQQQLCGGRITEEDLQLLLRELKRKVDFTEKMNWLSLSNRPNPPAHRKSSLPKHSEIKAKFLDIANKTFSDDVKAALRLPTFDCYEWEDYEILRLMETMFIELNFIEKFHISPIRLREWLYEVYKHYNDVPFHNFRHCFCVAQMMYAITWQTNLICRLGDMDVFILLISCICHDLDHPGYNNIYQINAKTELALRYNDISPLENHHCSIAFRLLEYPECNLLENITKDMYREIREGIIRCILATDMARHNEILTQFREITSIFDYNNASHKNLLCMVLIKVADISNEARPLSVAEPWLDRLLQEFFAQSAAEKMEGLPVTPFMDPEKVSKPGSQVRFIGLVLLPLFEALGDLLPELIEFIIMPVRFALDFYKRLNDAQQKNRKSLADTEGSSDGDEIIPRSQSGISVRSRRSIPSQKSASRNSVDEESMLIAAELHDLPEGSESGDSETATEVDVAEKTSKFKVDTESRNKLNTQMIHHRSKHHRDKRPSMVSEMGGRMRGSYGNIQNTFNTRTNTFGNNRAISLDHYSNHRRMSDGIQTVTSDSTVYYHQRLQDQDNLLLRAAKAGKSASSCQTSSEVKLLVSSGEGPIANENVVVVSDTHTHRVQSTNNSSINNNNNNSNSSNNNSTTSSSVVGSKSVKSKLSSSVTCNNNSPKSIITRLRQLTGRLSFSSFEKDSTRRISTGGGTPQTTLIKTSTTSPSKNNNMMPNICCNTKSAIGSAAAATTCIDATSRNRAYSLDVPPMKFNYNSSAASSNNGSHKSLSSTTNNRNDELVLGDDSTDTNSAVYASKKMSAAEVEPIEL